MKSKGTYDDEFITVTAEEYNFVHWNWTIPSASVYSSHETGKLVSTYHVICPEYAKLRQSRLMKLIL